MDSIISVLHRRTLKVIKNINIHDKNSSTIRTPRTSKNAQKIKPQRATSPTFRLGDRRRLVSARSH